MLFGGSFILLTYSADYTDTMSGGHRLVRYTAAQAVQQILRAIESDTDDTNDSSDSEHEDHVSQPSEQSDVKSADDTASVTDNRQSAIQGLDSNAGNRVRKFVGTKVPVTG